MNASQSSPPDGASRPSTAAGSTTDQAAKHATTSGESVGLATGSQTSSRGGVSGAVIFWLALLLVFAGAMTLWGAWRLFQGSNDDSAGVAVVIGQSGSPEDGQPGIAASVPGSDESWIDEFTLTERSGQPFDSRDLAGKVWVASFFFATCPSYCVQQNNHIKALQDQFGEQGVVFVSITCDPKQDTPEKLREYARRFDADPTQWVFLTGDLTYIRRIGAEKFRQPVHEQTHKNNLVVVDKAGEMRGSFDWNDEAEMTELRQLLPELLAEAPPADQPPGDAAPEATKDQAGSDAAGSDAAGSDAAGSDAAGSDAAGSGAASSDAASSDEA